MVNVIKAARLEVVSKVRTNCIYWRAAMVLKCGGGPILGDVAGVNRAWRAGTGLRG
jgi:hypothetical protein